MKVPKHIEAKLKRRAKLAADLMSVDVEVSNWLEQNEVFVGDADVRSGVEMYCNPYASADRVLQCIKEK